MKILVTGNPNFGLAESISKIYTDAKFVTKSAGFDLTSSIKQDELSNIALDYDVFVLCSYIPDYVPNILLQKVYDNCKKNNHKIHIIVIGSTVDRVKDGRVLKYAEEKKALRDMCANNHDHTKTLNQEVQKLIKVMIAIEQRVSKLEAK